MEKKKKKKTNSRIPKAVALLRLLSNEEYKDLKAQLTKQQKTRVMNLLENLWKLKGSEFSDDHRSSLFQTLFSEKYEAKKDYLLRNEFRLLSRNIEDFLVAKEISEEVEQNQNAYNYYLLRVLQDRKSLDLFKKEYKDAYDHALENADYYAAHNITGLNFINYTQFLNIKEKDIEYMNHLNDMKLTHLSCYYLTAFRTHQINTEFTRTFFYPFSIHEVTPSKEVKVDFEQYENDYSGYLFLKAKSFLVPHEKRIELLEQCLVFLKKQSDESALFQQEHRFCLSNLANAYSLIEEYEKATFYFEAFFQIEMEKDDPQRLSVLCDYITKLIKLNDFAKAIELMEENQMEINQIEKLRIRLLCLQIACYAFVGRLADLQYLLPNSFSDYSKQLKFFFRLYYSIYAYLNKDLDEAERESMNMKNISRSDEGEFDVDPILKFFNRFFYILHKYLPSQPKRSHFLQKLQVDVDQYDEETLPEYRSYLPFLWLKRELVTLIGINPSDN